MANPTAGNHPHAERYARGNVLTARSGMRTLEQSLADLVQQGASDQVLSNPQSDYTRELIDAIPKPPVG